jgi:CHASE2 domain-containing sensor protein
MGCATIDRTVGLELLPFMLACLLDILKSWDRDTRIEGPLMAIVLVLALLAPLLARDGPRRLAILCAIVSAVLIVSPILVLQYDWRFMIPVFGPLTAGAAIGGFEIWRRIAARAHLRGFALARRPSA